MSRYAFAVVFLIMVLWPSASQGQGRGNTFLPIICNSVLPIEHRLREVYEERRVAGGETNNPYTAELWLSLEGTWSFLFRFEGSVLCLVEAGHYWRELIDGIPILDREDRQR